MIVPFIRPPFKQSERKTGQLQLHGSISRRGGPRTRRTIMCGGRGGWSGSALERPSSGCDLGVGVDGVGFEAEQRARLSACLGAVEGGIGACKQPF